MGELRGSIVQRQNYKARERKGYTELKWKKDKEGIGEEGHDGCFSVPFFWK